MDKIKHFEYLIVGGGITGAGVFRDLALHGKKVLLVDKKKFLSQTSSISSKMLHGGIRYLEHLEFSLVSEALKEKNTWKNNAPHLVKEKEFFIPVYKNSPHSLLKLFCGVKLYDALSYFQNSPSGKLSKDELLKKSPELESKDLLGAITYYDVILDDKDFGLKNIKDVLSLKNTSVKEETEVISISREKHLKITLSNNEIITCEELIFCTGPFTDQVLKNLSIPWKPKILPSKGSHLKLDPKKINCPHPIVIQEKNRVIFIIPHDDFILLGTTELKLSPNQDFFDMKISEEEKKYLIHHFNRYFPGQDITNAILNSTAGVRPLVISKGLSENQAPGAVSRNHQIFIPQENMYVLIGGKYTTFRKMAADLVAQIFRKKQIPYHANLTLEPIRKTK